MKRSQFCQSWKVTIMNNILSHKKVTIFESYKKVTIINNIFSYEKVTVLSHRKVTIMNNILSHKKVTILTVIERSQLSTTVSVIKR